MVRCQFTGTETCQGRREEAPDLPAGWLDQTRRATGEVLEMVKVHKLARLYAWWTRCGWSAGIAGTLLVM
jgi:hypothetical protein